MKFLPKLTVFFLAMMCVVSVFAASASEIKARMRDRAPVIKELITNGIVREAATGYLEYVPGKTKEKESVVKAENADRKTVYAAIAKQQGTTTDVVARTRGKQNTKK